MDEMGWMDEMDEMDGMDGMDEMGWMRWMRLMGWMGWKGWMDGWIKLEFPKQKKRKIRRMLIFGIHRFPRFIRF